MPDVYFQDEGIVETRLSFKYLVKENINTEFLRSAHYFAQSSHHSK